MSSVLRVSLAALAALVGGCAGVPPASPSADDGALPVAPASATPGAVPTKAVDRFEHRWQERVREQQRNGCPADAAVSLEVLALLRPDDTAVRAELDALRRQLAARAAELMQHARQAQARGSLDTAEQQYLAVLALQPDHAGAVEALRALERERNRRNLYKPPRRGPTGPGKEFASAACAVAATACPAGCAPSP
jgi:hypothetical protein